MKTELQELQEQMVELQKTEVFYDACGNREFQKVYRKYRRDLRALGTKILKIEVQAEQAAKLIEYNERVAAAKDEDIQAFADNLHDINCGWNHMDRCDYHYGNWDNDVRWVMLEYYDFATVAMQQAGEIKLEEKLETIAAGRQAEKDLRELKELMA
jgi:hypothetical protein